MPIRLPHRRVTVRGAEDLTTCLPMVGQASLPPLLKNTIMSSTATMQSLTSMA